MKQNTNAKPINICQTCVQKEKKQIYKIPHAKMDARNIKTIQHTQNTSLSPFL